MIVLRWWFGGLITKATFIQAKSALLLIPPVSLPDPFLDSAIPSFALPGGRELGEIVYEKHQLPAVLVFLR